MTDGQDKSPRPAPVVERPPEIAYEFYSKQFFMHIEKVNALHEERNRMMRYSIAATFAYFGWIFTHPDIADKYQSYFIVKASIWGLPFGFNLFGLWRNRVLLETIRKHGDFLDYLLNRGMGERNHFRDYLVVDGKTPPQVHSTVVYWRAIVIVSLLTAIGGIVTETILFQNAEAAS